MWTLTQADKKWLEAFEVWIWRRMLKIGWKDKVKNSSVLEKANEERNLEYNLVTKTHMLGACA